MKNFLKKATVSILLSSMFATACEQNDLQEEKPLLSSKTISTLATAIANSDDLQELGITPQALAIDQAEPLASDPATLVIPFVDQGHKKALLASTSSGSTLSNIKVMEVNTTLSPTQMQSQLQAGTFNATVHFYGNGGINENISIVNSRITFPVVPPTEVPPPFAGCKGATQRGGAFDCAGGRIEKMNGLDKGLCYMRFMMCLAQTVGSCLLDGCVNYENNPFPGTPEY